jgi:hypothetical protein
MSSATVLFVLRHILDLPAAEGEDDGAERICSMAFGPGLTVETALFTKLSSPHRAEPPTLSGAAAETESAKTGAAQPESALA